MDTEKKNNCDFLRSLDSQAAADWLLSDLGPKATCFYVSKRTWKKPEQIRLAEYFLSLMPHSSDSCYKSLLCVMSVTTFVKVAVKKIENIDPKELDFLNYYLLRSVSNACETNRDYEALSYLSTYIKSLKQAKL